MGRPEQWGGLGGAPSQGDRGGPRAAAVRMEVWRGGVCVPETWGADRSGSAFLSAAGRRAILVCPLSIPLSFG